jgi:hypothetical protein
MILHEFSYSMKKLLSKLFRYLFSQTRDKIFFLSSVTNLFTNKWEKRSFNSIQPVCFFPISFRNSHILSIEIHIHIKFFPSKRWPPNRPGELKSKCGEPLASREV